MIELRCSSMDHVADRAKAFLFCDPPYEYHEVRPDGVILQRLGRDADGWRTLETIYVKLAGRLDPVAWNIATDYAINGVIAAEQAKRCGQPAKCFLDEVNDSPIKPLTMYADALLEVPVPDHIPTFMAAKKPRR